MALQLGCFNIARDLEKRNLPGDARIVRVIRLWLGTDPFQIGRSLASLPGSYAVAVTMSVLQAVAQV
jgi:hypothetical protein